MTALIVDRTAGQRCDSRCHTAAHSGCDCVCGGELHGVGSSKAAQTRLQEIVRCGWTPSAVAHGESRVVRNLFGQVEVVEVNDMGAAAARCSVPDRGVTREPAGENPAGTHGAAGHSGSPASALPFRPMCARCGQYRAAGPWVKQWDLCAKCRGVA